MNETSDLTEQGWNTVIMVTFMGSRGPRTRAFRFSDRSAGLVVSAPFEEHGPEHLRTAHLFGEADDLAVQLQGLTRMLYQFRGHRTGSVLCKRR